MVMFSAACRIAALLCSMPGLAARSMTISSAAGGRDGCLARHNYRDDIKDTRYQAGIDNTTSR
jgi:hypothetical protein